MNQEPDTKSHEPLVTACIGVYNREKHIRECLDSVLAQTYPNLEIVVVDDASTDHTADLVRSYGSRVRLIQRATNSRCADVPRAQAVAAASGVWCAILDSDDTWYPNKIARQVEQILKHPEWGMVHSYVMVRDEYHQREYIRHEGAIPEGPQIAPDLLRHCFICTSSVMVKKAAWLEAFDEVKPATFGTDWDMFISVAKRYPVGFISEVLVSYRKAASGISQQNWKRVSGDLLGLDRIYGSSLWKGVLSRKEMLQLWVKAAKDGSDYWRGRGEMSKARWFVGRGLQRAPFSTALWLEGAKSLVGRKKFRSGEG